MCFTDQPQQEAVMPEKSSQDRKREALQRRIEEERRLAGPKITPKAFEKDDFLPDGTVKPKSVVPAPKPAAPPTAPPPAAAPAVPPWHKQYGQNAMQNAAMDRAGEISAKVFNAAFQIRGNTINGCTREPIMLIASNGTRLLHGARIGNNWYGTLSEAAAAAKAGDVIVCYEGRAPGRDLTVKCV